MKRSTSAQGSSTLLVTLILLLLSGSCLALLMATQTGMLVAAQQKVQARLLAAADGGVELGVARGMAGAVDPTARTLGGGAPGAEVVVEVSGFVPAASAPCRLCMTNLEGTLGSMGGLRRVSHVVSATASAPSRSDGLPPPRRSVSAVVDLTPWPAGSRDRWDLAATAPPRPDPLSSFVDPSDDDGNGAPDLGEPLSPPAIVRLNVGEGDGLAAVFGGGYDRTRPAEVGNWLYIVGVESGALLYKRRLDAPATATPAAADLDGDGTADRLYAGTLAGSLYRVDVSAGAPLAGGRVAASAWAPRRVFETGGLPIRHPPAVVPVPETGALLLAFGTGAPLGGAPPEEPAAGRFFVIADKGPAPAEAAWSLALDRAEELASPPLAVAGLLTFLTFRPSGPDVGELRRYSLRLRSGEAVGGGSRAFVVDAGAPRPATDFGSPTRIDVDHPGRYGVPLSPGEEREVEALRAAMPRRCRFGGSRVRLEAEGLSGAPLRLAVLPVCHVEVDWFGG
ncbi:MAG: PilC/PilY family type IV pilus protein [Acidobacteria bacterium]|nr:PilC/PilY family type IV pilus protein [Acidobacteriota bacterium]